ncbi:hypothetical protein E4U43_003083 [Claviceps pusilla]|uniref:Uncharacterized protein n=1 Tax=Claviceps pusilla TaxID=123648 RepID=A0A9P7NG21_9HYPO|nr:hypothetical protein E4U43_003083 [Claviceps pusilla]
MSQKADSPGLADDMRKRTSADSNTQGSSVKHRCPESSPDTTVFIGDLVVATMHLVFPGPKFVHECSE